jgi:hypothetical protein
MKEKIVAALAMISLLLAGVKFAATELVELLKHLVLLTHDFWAFVLGVWK